MLYKLRRFLFWGWKLRNSYDWDNGYLYEIMYLKLSRMRKHMSEHGTCGWNQHPDTSLMRKLRIAEECSKRLSEGNYFCSNYFNRPSLMVIRNDQEARDLGMLCEVLRKYSRHFWD